MKINFLKSVLLVTIVLLQTACYKTYTCQCTYTSASGSSSGALTTGQVKAMSKSKAEKLCAKGGCSGGQSTVK